MTNMKIIFTSIILIVFLLFVGGTMPYFLFYIFLLIFLIPLFHSLIIRHKLKGYVQIPEDSLYAGEEISINYEINNGSNFNIPYLEIQNHISKQLTGIAPPEIITNLKPKESFRHKETIVLKRRGYYQLGEIEVNIRDVFGLYSLRKKVASEASLLVYPKPIDLNSFKITAVEQLGELLIENFAFQDRSRISTIREFREGDSVKSIHWKLSAKVDNLIIKDYENRGDTYVVIFIDNYKKYFQKDVDRRLEDKAVDIALSIVNYYLNKNIPVHLYTQDGERIVEIYGEQNSDIKPFLIGFAKFKGNGTRNFNPSIQNKANTLRKGATVIIITPNLDKPKGTLGILLKTKYLKPLIIVTTDKENNSGILDPIVEKGLRQEAIPLYILDYKANIKEALEGKNG